MRNRLTERQTGLNEIICATNRPIDQSTNQPLDAFAYGDTYASGNDYADATCAWLRRFFAMRTAKRKRVRSHGLKRGS